MLYVFQIGKEHVGLKAVTEILQDIQYKVSYYFKKNESTGYGRGPQDRSQVDDSLKGLMSWNSCYAHGCGWLQTEDTGEKWGQCKGAWGRVREKPNISFPLSYPSGIALGWAWFFQQWCVTARVKCHPSQRRLAEPLYTGILLGVGYMSTRCVCHWLHHSHPSPSKTTRFQKSRCQGKLYLVRLVECGPRSQAYRNILISQNVPQPSSQSRPVLKTDLLLSNPGLLSSPFPLTGCRKVV